MAKKWFSIMAMMVVLSMLLSACGETATVVPATATTGTTAAPTATTAAAAPTATKAAAAPTATTAAAGATATTASTGSTPGTKTDYSKVGPELAAAFAGTYKGKGLKVSMYGPFTTDDEVKFNNSMKDFRGRNRYRYPVPGRQRV